MIDKKKIINLQPSNRVVPSNRQKKQKTTEYETDFSNNDGWLGAGSLGACCGTETPSHPSDNSKGKLADR